MENHEPESQGDLLEFGGLARESVDELIFRAYGAYLLTDDEQILFGLRYGFLAVDAEEGHESAEHQRPMNVNDVAAESKGFTGKRMSYKSVALAIEMAEAKIGQYIREQVNVAVKQFIDRTSGQN